MNEGQFKSFIINLLRRGTFLWKPRNEAKRKARVQNGTFKNGNPKFGYRCNSCKQIFGSSEVQVDHIEPVIGNDGFTSWDDYISRMFCDVDMLQILCEKCHDVKSSKEVQIRKKYRKKKKKIDTKNKK